MSEPHLFADGLKEKLIRNAVMAIPKWCLTFNTVRAVFGDQFSDEQIRDVMKEVEEVE